MIKEKYVIGVFDSGFGGLAILKEIVKKLPEYNYLYLGDTARAPYGSRSQQTIYQFTQQAVDFLFKNNCYLIILACNTASSQALRRIQNQYLPKHYGQRRVLGAIIPASEQAVQETKNNKIGVIGTEATTVSGTFKKELKKLNSQTRVYQQACPLLVPIIEAGEQNSLLTTLALKNYLQPVTKQGIDTLILGCTHYGLIQTKIKKIVGKHIKVIGEGRVIAEKLKDYLNRHPEIESQLKKNKQMRFLTTDLTDRFEKLGSQFYGRKIKAQKIKLE